MPDEEKGGAAGTFDSVRRIGTSALGLLQNRLSLVAVELQEEKLRVISLLMWVGVALLLAAAGIMVAIAALALFLWERAGYAGLIGLALAALAGGFVMVLWVRRHVMRGPQPFATTVSEFGKDLQCLRPPP